MDAEWRDYPVAPDPLPEPFIVVDAGTVVVGTVPEADGNVRVRVLSGPPDPSILSGFTHWWDGSIDLPSGIMQVGNVETNVLHEVPLTPGRHRLRVFVYPDVADPDQVIFLVDA
jgi:hypothetical protein